MHFGRTEAPGSSPGMFAITDPAPTGRQPVLDFIDLGKPPRSKPGKRGELTRVPTTRSSLAIAEGLVGTRLGLCQ